VSGEELLDAEVEVGGDQRVHLQADAWATNKCPVFLPLPDFTAAPSRSEAAQGPVDAKRF
jgi:hypothetical protein